MILNRRLGKSFFIPYSRLRQNSPLGKVQFVHFFFLQPCITTNLLSCGRIKSVMKLTSFLNNCNTNRSTSLCGRRRLVPGRCASSAFKDWFTRSNASFDAVHFESLVLAKRCADCTLWPNFQERSTVEYFLFRRLCLLR